MMLVRQSAQQWTKLMSCCRLAGCGMMIDGFWAECVAFPDAERAGFGAVMVLVD